MQARYKETKGVLCNLSDPRHDLNVGDCRDLERHVQKGYLVTCVWFSLLVGFCYGGSFVLMKIDNPNNWLLPFPITLLIIWILTGKRFLEWVASISKGGSKCC